MARLAQILLIVVILGFFLLDVLDIFFGIEGMFESETWDNEHGDDGGRSDTTATTTTSHRTKANSPAKQTTKVRSIKEKAAAGAADQARKMALSEAFLVAIDRLEVESIESLLKNPLVNVNYENRGHTALFRLTNREAETKASIEILTLLVARPELQVNGNGRTWPPLKLALSRQMVESAKLLMSHPDISQFVFTAGLSCNAVDVAPEEVVFVLEQDAMPCFKRVGVNSLTEKEFFEKFPERKPGGKKPSPSSSPSSSGSSRGSKNGGGRGGSGASSATTYPAGSLVMNPTGYTSVYSALLAYVVGENINSPTLTRSIFIWITLVTTHVLLLLLILLMAVMASANRKEEEEKAKAEEAAGKEKQAAQKMKEEAEAAAAEAAEKAAAIASDVPSTPASSSGEATTTTTTTNTTNTSEIITASSQGKPPPPPPQQEREKGEGEKKMD